MPLQRDHSMPYPEALYGAEIASTHPYGLLRQLDDLVVVVVDQLVMIGAE